MSTIDIDASSLDRSYAFLDDCPEHVFADVVTLPIGALPDRVTGVRCWRDALLAGDVPPVGTWPAAPIDGPARTALRQMNLPKFCVGQPDLADAVLADVVASFGKREAAFRADVLARLQELEQAERIRLRDELRKREKSAKGVSSSGVAAADKLRAAWGSGERRSRGGGPVESNVGEDADATPQTLPTLDAATLARLRAQAERDAAALPQPADEAMLATWSERARAWAEIMDVFGDLGEMMGRGWDLARGVLKHVGWKDLLRLQALLKDLPELREIIRALGRLHDSDREHSVAEALFVPVRRLEEERREVKTPLVPAETRGIIRSGEIARMLPVEAVMLGHPQLRLLWHARRAERALLTYRVEGMEIERVQVEREVLESQERRRPRPERGPILAVIDTSGSMNGLPERVAKALVLEAVRTAHMEKRRCYLYAYSGPGDVLEHELDLGPDGIGRLLMFLQHSFGGGTDIGAMSTVVARLGAEGWKKADVLLVSDGEWHAGAAIVSAVERAKGDGTRFHGVQIGNHGRTGLHTLCDPVHLFQDWATAGGWR